MKCLMDLSKNINNKSLLRPESKIIRSVIIYNVKNHYEINPLII